MGDEMDRTEWLLCPICQNKTRNKIRADTELKNFPLYCPKCKNESLVNVQDFQVEVIQSKRIRVLEPDA